MFIYLDFDLIWRRKKKFFPINFSTYTKLDLTPNQSIVSETDPIDTNQVQDPVEKLTTVLPQIVLPASIILPIQITQSVVIPVNILKNRKMEAKITCGEFTYSGESTTLGSRWESWSEQFQLFIKMGQEAFKIYKTKRKADGSDTLKEVQKFMADHFVPKKSGAEICAFRRAMRHEGELVSEYAMRLRTLATHCKFGATLGKEIDRQFVV